MDSVAQFGSRALFPTLDCRIYANHASVGPLPLPAIEAMNAVIAGQAQQWSQYVEKKKALDS